MDSEFSVLVPERGFKLSKSGLQIVPVESGALTRGRVTFPLLEEPELFMKFAGLVDDWSPAAALDFANRHGPLETTATERLVHWSQSAVRMHAVTMLWNALCAGDVEDMRHQFRLLPGMRLLRGNEPISKQGAVFFRAEYARSGVKWKRIQLPDDDGDVPGATFNVVLGVVARELEGRGSLVPLGFDDNYRVEMKYVPNGLLGAMWLQLSLYLDSENRVRRCVECGQNFMIRRAKGMWNAKRFCGSACKSADFRRRQAARDWSSRGKLGAAAIAKKVSNSRRTVTASEVSKWLRVRRA